MHNYAAGGKRLRTRALEPQWGAVPVEQYWQRTGIASRNKFHTLSVSQLSQCQEKDASASGLRLGGSSQEVGLQTSNWRATEDSTSTLATLDIMFED